MINNVIIDGDQIKIPIFESSDYAIFEWKEDESVTDFLKNHKTSVDYFSDIEYMIFRVWSKEETHEIGTFSISAYEVKDKSNKDWYLMVHYGLDEYDSIKDSVCIPLNHLNLLLFYQKFLLPFADKNFEC